MEMVLFFCVAALFVALIAISIIALAERQNFTLLSFCRIARWAKGSAPISSGLKKLSII